MSRIIKFRGKNKDIGWVYGGLIHITSIHSDNEEGQIDVDKYYIITEEGVQFEVIPETIGQFTGLYDKNEKEIYEGDIVKYNEYWEGDCYFPSGYGIIMWDEEEAMFFLSDENKKNQWLNLFELTRNLNAEVIGNIIDNKNLLKEK